MEQEQNSRDISGVARTVSQAMETAYDITDRPMRSETAMRYSAIGALRPREPQAVPFQP